MRFIVFDTETTGFFGRMDTVNGRSCKSSGEIIQLSAIVCDMNKNVTDFISFYCMPTKPITDGAYSVHNISNEDIPILSEGLPLEYYLCDKYKDLFYSKGNIFVGHNVSFDIRSVNRDLENYGNPLIDFGNNVSHSVGLSENKNYHMDTMKICKSEFNYYKNPKLSEAINILNAKDAIDQIYPKLLRRFHKESSRNFHNADYDTCCTWALLSLLNR